MHNDVDIPCSDPSDLTELIGNGKADLGTKAMMHTIAGKARGFPIKSIGTLMGGNSGSSKGEAILT